MLFAWEADRVCPAIWIGSCPLLLDWLMGVFNFSFRFLSSLYILDINSSSAVQPAEIFLHSVCHLFHSINYFFCCAETFFNFMRTHLFTVGIVSRATGVPFRKGLPEHMPSTALPASSSNGFRVPVLTWRSLHRCIDLVQLEKGILTPFHVWLSSFLVPLMRLSFLQCVFWHRCQQWHGCSHVYIYDIYSPPLTCRSAFVLVLSLFVLCTDVCTHRGQNCFSSIIPHLGFWGQIHPR